MKYSIRAVLSVLIVSFFFAAGVFVGEARAIPSGLNGEPVLAGGTSTVKEKGVGSDYYLPGKPGGDCIETCSIQQEEYYDDEGYEEEQYEEPYEENYEEPYEEEYGGAEEQYNDEYGDPEYQDEVYPDDEYGDDGYGNEEAYDDYGDPGTYEEGM